MSPAAVLGSGSAAPAPPFSDPPLLPEGESGGLAVPAGEGAAALPNALLKYWKNCEFGLCSMRVSPGRNEP